MKKTTMLSSLLAAATLSLSSAVLADPISNYINFTCPTINVISNFGQYIAGYGNENIFSQNIQVYFKSNYYPQNVPDSLVNYNNSATNYDSVTSLVICSYTSSNPAEQEFDLNYFVTNGKGGIISSQNNAAITVNFPIGLHS